MTRPRFCEGCGSGLSPAARYCQGCGRPVGAPAPPTPPPAMPPPGGQVPGWPPTNDTRVVPPSWLNGYGPDPGVHDRPPRLPQPGATPRGSPGGPFGFRAWSHEHGFDGRQFATGDWSGAALAALGGLTAMVMVAVVGSLLVRFSAVALLEASSRTSLSEDSALSGFVPVVAMIVALAMGGRVVVDGGNDATSTLGSDASVTGLIGFAPLGVTVIGLLVVAIVFVVRLRSTQAAQAADVVLQGVRVALIWAVGLFVDALVGRWQVITGTDPSTGSPFSVHVTTEIAGTVFFGCCWLLPALAAVTFARLPHLLPPALRRWRDMVGGAFDGAVWALIALGALTALVSIGLSVGQAAQTSPSDPAAVIGLVFAYVLMVWPAMLTGSALAIGVPVDIEFSGLGLPESATRSLPSSVNLLYLTDQNPLFWFMPLFAVAVLLAGGVWAALHAPSAAGGRRYALLMGPALAAVLLPVTLATGIELDVTVAQHVFHLSAAISVGFALLLGLLWGAGAGWVGARLAPKLSPAVVHFVQRRVGRVRGQAAVPSGAYTPSRPY